jgi:hypothetical protein
MAAHLSRKLSLEALFFAGEGETSPAFIYNPRRRHYGGPRGFPCPSERREKSAVSDSNQN